MKLPTIVTTLAIVGSIAASPAAFAAEEVDEESMTVVEVDAEEPQPESLTVVEIAASNPDFSTLVAAVKAAGLAETLSAEGPFTIFAPNNAAFAKLPAGTVEALLLPENKEKLQAILTLHVLGDKVLAADIKPGEVKTLNGADVDIQVSDGTVTVDESKVIKTDIEGSNGVIHVIDTVILPES